MRPFTVEELARLRVRPPRRLLALALVAAAVCGSTAASAAAPQGQGQQNTDRQDPKKPLVFTLEPISSADSGALGVTDMAANQPLTFVLEPATTANSSAIGISDMVANQPFTFVLEPATAANSSAIGISDMVANQPLTFVLEPIGDDSSDETALLDSSEPIDLENVALDAGANPTVTTISIDITVQRMVVDSVIDDLDGIVVLADASDLLPGGRARLPWVAGIPLGPGPAVGWAGGVGLGGWGSVSAPRPPAPMPLQQTGAPVTAFFSNVGSSTGEAFVAQFFTGAGAPRSIDVQGLVLEPVQDEVRQQLQQQLQGLMDRNPVTARLNAYCLEFLRLPPLADTMFQIAPAEIQQMYQPVRDILSASRTLQQAGMLPADSDPESYFHSIRQWAVWTAEEGFDEQSYADAFVAHTRKNLEAQGRAWSTEMEEVLRGVVPDRWQNITRILEAAGQR